MAVGGTGVGVAVGMGVGVVVGVAGGVGVGRASTVAWTLATTVASTIGVGLDVGLGRAAFTAASTVAPMSGVGTGVGVAPHAITNTWPITLARPAGVIKAMLLTVRYAESGCPIWHRNLSQPSAHVITYNNEGSYRGGMDTPAGLSPYTYGMGKRMISACKGHIRIFRTLQLRTTRRFDRPRRRQWWNW